ncbi:MAG: TIGR04283 family arsenosugar biosynthesis glycosyltransferase [Pseudomonadota bacterium]
MAPAAPPDATGGVVLLGPSRRAGLSIIIPTLNEAKALPATLKSIARMQPGGCDVIVVDAGSTDETVTVAKAAGAKVIENAPRRRAAQMNIGARQAREENLVFLHADTPAPLDMAATIAATLADQGTAAGGFVSIMRGQEKTRWLTSAHNYIKSYYAPLIFRPVAFVRGVRLLFGDQAIFCRARDFRAIGGFDPETPIMEEADFVLRMVRSGRGRIRQIHRLIYSSDRRVAVWGGLKANLKYLEIGILWGLGVPGKRLHHRYPDVR